LARLWQLVSAGERRSGLLCVISPQSTNELRLSGNWVPWDSQNDQRIYLAVTANPLATAPDSS
jgi:hypothetical protein